MRKRKWERRVEMLFDGEGAGHDSLEDLSARDPEASAYIGELESLREAARQAVASQEITDAQFPAFYEGVRAGIGARHGGRRGLWAVASLTAAALIAAGSTFLVLSGETPDATATTVEEATTDIEGATVDLDYSEDGDATIYLEVPDGDLW